MLTRFAIVGVVLLSGCLRAPEEVVVVVAPAAADVPVGGHLQLTATVTGTGDPGVIWTVEGAGAIGSDGNYAAPGALPGDREVIVRATSIGDPAASATATLTIVPANAVDPVAVSISPPKAALAIGGERTFTVSGLFADGSSRDVTSNAAWTLEPAAVATVSSGVVTAVGAGIASLRATVGDVSASAVVTVSPGDPEATLHIAPGPLALAAGASAQLTATLTNGDGSLTDVTATATWAVDAPAVATVGHEGADLGLVTAAAPGEATVTATFEGVAASVVVTVTPATLQSIAVAPAAGPLALGLTRQLVATATWSDGAVSDVTDTAVWTSTKESVATVDKGLVTSLAVGEATVRATAFDVFGEAAVAVTPAAVIAVVVTPNTVSLPAGLGADLDAKATYSDGGVEDVTATAAWSSTAPAVATASAGHVDAVAPGAASIKAAYGGVTGATEVVVLDAALVTLEVAPAEATLALGQTVALAATGTYTDGSVADVTALAVWESDAATVLAPGAILASTEGEATVTATLDGIEAAASLHVTPAILIAIDITPPAASLAVGLAQPFSAKGTWSDGTAAALEVEWASVAPQQASVSQGGTVTAHVVADVVLVATAEGLAATALVSVTQPALVGLVMTPPAGTVSVDSIFQFEATGTWSDGSTGPAEATWTSLQPAIASVTQQDLFLGVSAGTATVRATAGGLTAEAKLTVTTLKVVAIEVTPAKPTLPVGETLAFKATATWSNSTTSDVTHACYWHAFADSPLIAVSNAAGAQGEATALAEGKAAVAISCANVTGLTEIAIAPAAPAAIVVTPGEADVAAGRKAAFTATATFESGQTGDVTALVAWSTADPAVAAVAADGVAKGYAAGATEVTATLGDAVGTAALTVNAPVVAALALSPPAATLSVGAAQAFTATATWSDGTTSEVTPTWATTAPAVATATAGVATAVAPGDVEVFAVLDGVAASATVTVVAAALVSIAVTPADATLAVGQTLGYVATGTYSDGSSANVTGLVTWSAKGGATVDSGGLATATAPGAATIEASLGGIAGSASLDVTAPVLVLIAIDPLTATLAAGTTVALDAVGHWSDGSTTLLEDVAWSADPPSVASVSAAGVVSGLTPGKASITAATAGLAGGAVVIVGEPMVTSIAVAPLDATLSVGATKAYAATATFSDGSTGAVTMTATWSSSDPLVASFNGAPGVALGVGPGTVTVTAALGGASGKATLKVAAATLTSITVKPPTATVPAGKTQAFTASGSWSDGTQSDVTAAVTWAALPAGSASISPLGVATAIVEGAVTVTATAGGVTGSASLTITAPELESLTLTPPAASLPIGQSATFKALAVLSDGTAKDVTAAATWHSDAPAVAQVTGGVAKALAAGVATIEATWSGKTGTAKVVVAGRYLPMKVGAKWTYLITDTAKGESGNRNTVVEALEDIGGEKAGIVAFRVRQEKLKGHMLSWQQDTGTAIVKHKDVNYKASGPLKSTLIVTPSRLRSSDLPIHTTLGAVWTESYTEALSTVATGQTVTTSETDEWTVVAVDEPVTVPAGTFLCLHIHRVGVNVDTDKTYWFARGVGKVKQLDGTETEVLVSYTLP